MDLLRRIIHAFKRDDSWKSILREKMYKYIFVNNKIEATEIQYLKEHDFATGIVEQTLVTYGSSVEFYSNVNRFSHTFSPREKILIENAVLNTRTGTIWAESKSHTGISLISESTEWPDQHTLLKHQSPKLNDLKEIDRGKLGLSNAGFFHWFQEALPQMSDQTSSRKILQFENINKLNLEVIEYFKADHELVPEWVRVKELEFETKGKDVGYLHPLQLQRLKQISNEVNQHSSDSPQKIYVSRLNQRRSASNEKQLLNFLSNCGFYIFEADQHSFIDQIKLFANPRIVMGIHGAGLAHSLWNSEAFLVELMPKNRVNRCFEWQSLLNNNKYLRIDFSNNCLDLKSIHEIMTKNNLI
jgi:hypothetical protein